MDSVPVVCTCYWFVPAELCTVYAWLWLFQQHCHAACTCILHIPHRLQSMFHFGQCVQHFKAACLIYSTIASNVQYLLEFASSMSDVIVALLKRMYTDKGSCTCLDN
jgi:ATP/maltotriose-dependent transcriptional regulator MalT